MELHDRVKREKLPQHIAIIMDGNGRWASKRGMMRSFGHENGVRPIRDTVEAYHELRIQHLTLYCFSTENWSRPPEEVQNLMNLLIKTLSEEREKLLENDIRLNAIGQIEQLDPEIHHILREVMIHSKNNKNVLTLALNYGGQQEIVRAMRNIAKRVKENSLEISEIDRKLLENYLYTHDLPPVDLLIRTGGEQRISNFLLWQIAYAELYLSEVLWPDWRKEHFYQAILSYQQRERRFGKTSKQLRPSDSRDTA